MSETQIRQFSIETFYYSDIEVIKTMNQEDCLTEYASNAMDYLAIEKPLIKSLISGFLLIGVQFIEIEYNSADKELFDEVYDNCLYKLNFVNISLMLCKVYQIENDSDIIHKNYTMVLSDEDSSLTKYVNKNISEYINIILNNCKGSINDDETVVIQLLNNSEVDYEAKEKYIKVLTTTIKDITQISCSEIWTPLLSGGNIEFSVCNVVNYFKKNNTLDSVLVDFINNEPETLGFSNVKTEFDEELAEQLFDAVAICDSFENKKYKQILIGLKYDYNISIDGISDDKVNILINEKIIKMTLDNLTFIRETYPKHVPTFIYKNFDDFLKLQLELQIVDAVNITEVLLLLKFDSSDEKKMKLLSLTKEPISIMDQGYSDIINAYIIENNLKIEDKVFLYENFSQYGNLTQQAIVALTKRSVGEIITKNINIEDALLSILLQTKEVIRNQKIELFIMVIPKLNKDSCKKHFEELGLSNLKNIFANKGGRRKYDKNEETTKILETLKINNWIYDYRKDDKNSEKYFIIRNKSRNK